PFTITLATPLAPAQAITAPVTIDGTTQPGLPPGQLVAIDGATNFVPGDGLTLAAGSGGTAIKALAIGGFGAGSAIQVNSTGNTVSGDALGETGTGTPNPDLVGITFTSTGANTISGTAIFNNTQDGALINTSTGVVIGAGDTIENNGQNGVDIQ